MLLKHEDLSLDRRNLTFLTAVWLQFRPATLLFYGWRWEDHCGFLAIISTCRFSERACLSGIKLRNKEIETSTSGLQDYTHM